MPVSINGMYDALLVILDERNVKNDSFFKKELEQAFDLRKYVYYQNASLNADELWKDLEKKIADEDVILPGSERIVFCTYMDICDLNQEWLDRFRERMAIFKTRGMTQDRMQHYYLTFFRYEANHPLNRDKISDVSRLLNELWNPSSQSMHHSEFLMYAGGLGGNLNAQEKGMIRFLEILSTRDYSKAITIGNFTEALFVLSETEYYEENAINCRKRIDQIEKWLNQESDPNLDFFVQSISMKVSEWLRRYQEEMRQFQKGTGLYPISVSEYTAKGIGPFRKYERPAGLHPKLNNEKKQCQREFMNRMVSSEEKEAWKERLRQQMAFLDLNNLSRKENEELKGMIQNVVDNSEASSRLQQEERKSFVEAFKKWVDEFVSEEASEPVLQEERNEKAAELFKNVNELERASAFSDLDSCFEQIRSATRYRVPGVITTVDVEQLAIINNQVGQDWKIRGYTIAGIQEQDVIVLNNIYPYEIVYMKFGKYIALNQQNTEQQLQMVLA